ncbi:MAG: hypothetical protein HN687_12085 [Candidatus Marinimicrobia bacterium]|jgi:hypothetical protein|nr:hypothetical protein [Candidatus Neomarinimicrobiota bacterium]
MYYKSRLDKCGHPELYYKFLKMGYSTVAQAYIRIKDNRDILKECGITDIIEQEKIIVALQTGTANRLWLAIFFGIGGGVIVAYLLSL